MPPADVMPPCSTQRRERLRPPLDRSRTRAPFRFGRRGAGAVVSPHAQDCSFAREGAYQAAGNTRMRFTTTGPATGRGTAAPAAAGTRRSAAARRRSAACRSRTRTAGPARTPGPSLAVRRTFEDVAELLWTGEFPAPATAPAAAREPWQARPAALVAGRVAQAAVPAGTLPLERLQVIVPAMAATDPLRLQLDRSAVIAAGRNIIAGMVDCLPGDALLTSSPGGPIPPDPP